MRTLAKFLFVGWALAGCVVVDDTSGRTSTAVDPVCGARVDLSTPWRGRYRGQEYYFHSDYCRESFYSDPEAYLGSPYARGRYRRFPEHDVAYFVDPVCGRNVAASTPWWSRYEGQSYYFHSDQCLRRFQYQPGAYVGRYRKPAPQRYEAR